MRPPDLRPPIDPLLKLLGVVLLAVVIALVLLDGCPARGDETAWLAEAQRILNSPNVSAVKRDLVKQALAHRSPTWRAHTVYYHPREATNWQRWTGTCTGTLVRPGVASCTVASRSRWFVLDRNDHPVRGSGAWIWFRGHGITKVEDNFPESGDPLMFDLAPWAAYPSQSYENWLRDPTRVAIARSRNVCTDAVVLKPKGGWPQ